MNKGIFCVISLLLLAGCGGGGSDSNAGDDGNSSSDGASPGTSTRSIDCFNQRDFIVGTEASQTVRITTNGIQSPDFTFRTVAERITTFEGIENVLEIATYDDSDNNKTYVTWNSADSSVTTHGQLFEGRTIVYKPSGILLNYDLREGQSIDYPTITVYTNGVETGTLDMEFTYLARETVTVPLGTFESCKMELEIDAVIDGVSVETDVTQYYAVGTGVVLKEVSELSTNDGPTSRTIEETVAYSVTYPN